MKEYEMIGENLLEEVTLKRQEILNSFAEAKYIKSRGKEFDLQEIECEVMANVNYIIGLFTGYIECIKEHKK